MIIVEIVDPIDSRVRRKDMDTLMPCLSFPAQYWRAETVAYNKDTGKPIRRKVRKTYRKDVFTGKDDDFIYFPTGHVSRVIDYLNSIEEKCGVQSKPQHFEFCKPRLNGIEFRDDQLDLIQSAIDHKRGVIQAPTGTGKTILQLGLISCFPKCRTLILAHTIGIVDQTLNEIVKFGFNSVQAIGGTNRTTELYTDIVVSTMQSFVKLDPDVVADYFDMVIVDEAHHVSKLTGTYYKILSRLLAPLRFGFTATMPTSDEALFALEGMLGPRIAQQTIQQAAELEILAMPKIKLLKSGHNQQVKELRKYQDVYQMGVVANRQRNRIIIEEASKFVGAGKTVLILVTRIEHGENITEMADRLFHFPIEFVYGATESETREKIKHALIDKQVKCVIATVVWREGINIPSLDVVINACGGKSEIMTLQAIGRGLRKTKDKDEVVIVDIFDPSHHYLISHFGHRITLYMEQGWL